MFYYYFYIDTSWIILILKFTMLVTISTNNNVWSLPNVKIQSTCLKHCILINMSKQNNFLLWVFTFSRHTSSCMIDNQSNYFVQLMRYIIFSRKHKQKDLNTGDKKNAVLIIMHQEFSTSEWVSTLTSLRGKRKKSDEILALMTDSL